MTLMTMRSAMIDSVMSLEERRRLFDHYANG